MMQSQLHGIGGTACYGAILGKSPSKGARSPILWNAVFRAFNIDCIFGAYDVVESELGRVVEALKADSAFIGGAVAVPYKSAIISFLDELEPECERIGAVNALYRQERRLLGANTDGKGAVASLSEFVGDPNWLQGKRALMLGTGGAGRAVATYLAKNCGSRGFLRLCNRTHARAMALAEALRVYDCPVRVIALTELPGILPEVDLLVNCTTVGSVDDGRESADRLLNSLSTALVAVEELPHNGRNRRAASAVASAFSRNVTQSLELLAQLPRTSVVFDVIYRSRVSMLLKLAGALGLRTLDGLGMNLQQAVIACHSALVHSGLWNLSWPVDRIREVMGAVP